MNNRKTFNKLKERRKKRTRAGIFGTAEKPRFSVFRSNRYIYAQLIDDEKRNTLASASGKKPEEVGESTAKKAAEKGIKKAVFNRGGYKYHGRVKKTAEAARKAGLNI